VGVPFSKGYASFVDCGAYMGDSLCDLLNLKECETYIGFEADINNFEKLERFIDSLNESSKIKEIILLPCGVSDNNGYLSFNQDASKSSRFISAEDDGVKVPIVKIDDVLKKKKVSFIKMDIEGAEIPALNGAQNIIRTQTTDLAICVYHKVTDLWEIPLMLKSMCEEYVFYLRTHAPSAGETVLYATLLR